MAERIGFELRSSLILRKLLIIHKATIASSATVAQVGYSFGTHNVSPLTFEVAA